MKLTIQSLVLILFLVAAASTARAQDAASLLAGVAALNQVADRALDKADNILGDQQRMLYTNLVNYTAYLTGNLKYLSDDLDRKLTQKEMALLNDLNSITAKLQDETISWQAKLEDVAVILESTPGRIPFADKHPAPSFYNIPLITTTQKRMITVDIKGVRLNNRKNYIVFKDKKIPITSMPSDKQISFSVPLTSHDVFDANAVNTFKVVLFEDRFLRADKVHEYTPRFVVVPQQIAKVRVFYKVRFMEREESNNQSGIVHATSGSNNEKEVKKQFNVVNSAAEGWKIDRGSVKCSKESGNGDRHGAAGPTDQTEVSFVAKAWAKDGKATGRCNWNEFRMVNKEKIETSDAVVNFGTQEVVALPDNLTSLFKTEVEYYDTSIYRTSDTSFRKNYVQFDFKLLPKLFEVKFVPR